MYKPVPSKLDFPALEHEILRFWEESRAFDKLRAQNANGPRWSFLDGPITANNPMGVHHAWGRTYKDIYQRYKAMQGYHQRYQNGFDCQGLWVEVEVERELGFNSKREIEEYGLARFSEKCRERVLKYSGVQTQQSIRLGQWMDWDNSYFTLTDNNIEHIWHFLKRCHELGWLYQGARAMPWCIRCGTGLSQHELVGTDSYREVTHSSIVLNLPIVGREGEHLLVWTTTPWTLSANTALAVHPELEYLRVRQDGKVLILSRGTTDILDKPHEVLGTVSGADLVGVSYRGPFDDLEAQQRVNRRVVAWEDVGEAEGTGIVHIAPGCGAEDYELSRAEGLDVLVPINEFGDYVAGYGRLSGKNVRETNPIIFDDLRQRGVVNRVFEYSHRYPTCWRCGEELVFRLSQEWFIGVEEIRPRMKAAAATVWWTPASAGKRMDDWLNNMGDWNISRRRYWGLPLPFYPCQACGTLTVVGSMDELRGRAVSGLDQLQELHRPWIDDVRIRCSGCSAEVSRITEVGDAWLDAGIVPFSTMGPGYLKDPETWAEWYPADFITEMREQIRLWFYSMLFMSVTLEDRPPYQAVLAFEKLLDEHGTPMHKSLGNAIWFDEAAEKMGADVMRWLYASQNIQANLLFGYRPAEEVKRKLLVLWNTYSFFVTYASIDRYDPTSQAPVPVRERSVQDRWIISRLQELIGEVREGLDRFEASGPTDCVERFIDDLSTWYVRRSRRRFWKSEDDSDKRAAYDTLYEVLTTLSRLLAPILPFLAEAMHQNLVRSVDADAPESVHHTRYPEANPALRDTRVEAVLEQVREIVSLGRAARTGAKAKVRQPLALIRVAVTRDAPDLPDELAAEIRDELNVKRLEITRDLGEAASVIAKAKPQVLGPKLGKRFPEVQRALQQGRFSVREDGGVDVDGLALGQDEVDVARVPSEGWSVGQGDRYAVALDLRLTPELIAEGRARELVRRIQEMRKEAGFNVEDHILTEFQGSEDLERVLAQFGGYVRQETLSDDLRTAAQPVGFVWSGRIDGLDVTLGVQRVAAAE